MRSASFLLLAAVMMIPTVAGCGARGEESAPPEPAQRQATSPQEKPAASTAEPARQTAVVPLRPVGGSGVEGEAVLEEITGGIEVRLRLRNLPEPGAVYLAHIHEGTCAGEAERGSEHEHGSEDHEHGAEHPHGGEIEHPLSMVGANRAGEGSSKTTLWDVGLGELLSGPPRYINVHAPGQGNPPALACGELSKAAEREENRRR